MLITIQEASSQTSKTGKQFISVKDSNNQLYSCWDMSLLGSLTAAINKQVDVIVQTKQVGNKQYMNITGLTPQSTPMSPLNAAKFTPYKEDPDKQRLIVRQSCLAQAVAFHAIAESKIDDDRGVPLEQNILRTADIFVRWVYSTAPTFKAPASRPLPASDLPTIERDQVVPPPTDSDEINVESIPF